MSRRSLVWFRRDLRVSDQSALSHATHRAGGDGVVGLYVISPGEWRAHDDAPAKVDFWLRNVRALSTSLAALNIPLWVRRAEAVGDVLPVVRQAVVDAGCDALYLNREYEVDESRRDRAVADALRAAGVTVHAYDDRVLTPPGSVRTAESNAYTVFTPFRTRWTAVLKERGYAALPDAKAQSEMHGAPDEVPTSVEGFEAPSGVAQWPAGEAHAQARLREFADVTLRRYHDLRDRPDVDGTSALSPYLAAGVLSPRACLRAAAAKNGGAFDRGDDGVSTWVGELAWRDFYQHVMVAFPRVSMGRAFKPTTEKVPWRKDPDGFARWCEGRTGFPLVDAAMRQLAATGWMHNRLRMLVAMFLTKDLLVDWREGERFFMQHLVDGDLGANNGGWQWSASTGTDAQPYFRIFNPLSQSQRYDPDGAFIRKWVPELRPLSSKGLHAIDRLSPMQRDALGYPAPIVDHAKARVRALEAFKSL